MIVPGPISPLGTASAGFGGWARAHSDDAALLAQLTEIEERLRQSYNLGPETALLAWELARWQDGLDLDDRRAVMLLVLALLVNLRGGGTRLPFMADDGRRAVVDLLAPLVPDPEGQVERAHRLLADRRLDTLLGRNDEFRPLILDRGYLYIQKMLYLEDRFVERTKDRLEVGQSPRAPDDLVEAAIADVKARPEVRDGHRIEPTNEQLEAVRAAARHAFTVVSGGPGTGKTTVVVTILRVLARLGVKPEEITLAAPTGKAAQRMGAAIRAGLEGALDRTSADDLLLERSTEPRTLHRLLGYSPRTERFLHHENNQLAEQTVIVDEGSMIDLALMERLIRSLRPDARLVLLGDDHQLPSVEAGAVLRDLLGDGDAAASPLGPRGVRLVQSHRMSQSDLGGRNIYVVAQKVDSGQTVSLFEAVSSDDEIIRACTAAAPPVFQGVEFLDLAVAPRALEEFETVWHEKFGLGLGDIQRFVRRTYHLGREGFTQPDLGHLSELFRSSDRARVLCLTRVHATGADAINKAFHQHHRAEFPGEREGDFLPGEPIMMEVNDYSRMIFNGDQGLVLNVTDERGYASLMAVFPRSQGFAAFPLGPLRPLLTQSYALTVHKAQGSEFDHVALVLPESDLPLNTRELLYTALTRSKKSVTIVGRREVFFAGVRKRIQRYSGIAEKLRRATE